MNILDQESITGITALLVHAAKIDEQYSDHEKILIKEFIKSYLKDADTTNNKGSSTGSRSKYNNPKHNNLH